MQDIADALTALVVNLLVLIAGPTVLMLLVRRFVPYLGERLWRCYCDALIWCFRLPFRVVRFLVNELTNRRRL